MKQMTISSIVLDYKTKQYQQLFPFTFSSMFTTNADILLQTGGRIAW
jgi:DNA polymerase III sliding clamp (beta) subunit (PCNA family)